MGVSIKIKRARKKKPNPQKRTRRRLLNLWKEIVLAKYGRVCQNRLLPEYTPKYCVGTPVQCDHIRGQKAEPKYFLLPENGRPLCPKCHWRRNCGDTLADFITSQIRPADWEKIHSCKTPYPKNLSEAEEFLLEEAQKYGSTYELVRAEAERAKRAGSVSEQ